MPKTHATATSIAGSTSADAIPRTPTSLPREFIDRILGIIAEKPARNDLVRRKMDLAKEMHIGFIPSDILILTHLSGSEFESAKEALLTKPVRTGSGVTVIAVMTKPLPCPHGKCTYCPGGPGSFFGDVPQSYTGHEPATMRGMRAKYDAYTQVYNRLEQYIVSGHNPEKVELILMGGTFPSYDSAYQDEVIHDIFQAMDDFSEQFYLAGELQFAAFKEYFMLPGSVHDAKRGLSLQARIMESKVSSKRRSRTIAELQQENETAMIRCIGLTIETRPSHARTDHGLRMLTQGATRVELGVQTTYDDVLKKVHRDHTVQDTKDAISDLRDLGFKLNFHIMLGMPLMTPARDISAARALFEDQAFRPDMIKLYPCMVMPGTPLYYEWKAGAYSPYTTVQAADVISEIKRYVPEYTRIMRIQRDIPTKVTSAGVGETNLRQTVKELCDTKGISCRCIRCREPDKIAHTPVQPDISLNTYEYEASGGKEFFISAEDTANDRIMGFCRLRFPARSLHQEITSGTAIIRELHVYGTATSIGDDGRIQHRGLGRKLVAEAERIALTSGKDKMLIISGVGVREYYARTGYRSMGPYMGKRLAEHTPNNA
ncbi:TPA: tRNA uridine(34) 5-carboxymethylaminomethyl modification radical SAM/GNAT enzyme Elp3 [Candidatus Woesearchaeota archaeon]|nr:tRNA uridine(34) 5-carboxymethylaminomethyl modification radical SAM/GNAT enzyme Elp3 [Candidatus Woesearchaeota archaeon]